MKEPDALIIVGDGEFAEVAYECFTFVALRSRCIQCEKDYLKKEVLFGLPVVPFEELERLYGPISHKIFVPVICT